MEIKCPGCNQYIDASAKFCPSCGRGMAAEASQTKPDRVAYRDGNYTRIIGVVGVLVVICIAGAPYFTVHQIKAAAKNREGEALCEHIDFPSVRQSLKEQMNSMFIKEMSNDKMKDNPFAALGVAFAGVMVDKMVEAYVTPAGITQLMVGEKPQTEGGVEPRSSTAKEPLSDATMSYESLNKFVVTVKGNTGEEGKFVLRRRGLSWKLTEIVMPLKS